MHHPRMTGRLISIFVLCTACAHAPAPLVASDAETTSYLLARHGGTLEVALTLTAESPDVVIGCDRWAGLEECERSFVDIHAVDEAGQKLEVHQASNRWRIDARPQSRITIRYTLKPARPDAMADESTRFYPMLTDGAMHLIAHVGLLVPVVDIDPPRRIVLHWQGFTGVVSGSFGSGPDIELTRTYAELAHAVFIAGDYELFSEGNVTLAIRPKTWRFGGHDLLATALPIVEAERAVFHDGDTPLLIVASPMTAKDVTTVYGTMLTDSISLFLPRESRVINAPLVALLIAHEYFHQWDVNVMAPANDEGAGLAWFTEGFAELYMRRIAYRAGRITRNDYIWHWNQALVSYFTSPVISATNERIRAEFHTSPEINRLPYLRGQLIGLMVDEQMRSHGRTLDDFMRDIVKDARHSKQRPTTESVLKAIGSATSPELEEVVRHIVIDGRAAPVPTQALLPCLHFVEVLDERSKKPWPRLEPLPDGQASCADVL
jgi:predicted metalloprotease with PDZ domain